MKKIMLPVLGLVVMAMSSCSTCGNSGFNLSYTTSDEVNVSTRDIRGFEKIEVIGSPTVYYTQADSFSVRVKGPWCNP